MSFSIRDLRAKTEEELIDLHDGVAENTVVGVAYYLEELRRREQVAAIRSSQRLARAAFWLTAANTVLASLAVVLSLVA